MEEIERCGEHQRTTGAFGPQRELTGVSEMCETPSHGAGRNNRNTAGKAKSAHEDRAH